MELDRSKPFAVVTGHKTAKFEQNGLLFNVRGESIDAPKVAPVQSDLIVERGNAADKLNGRNINVSFTNNSNEPVEVMVFIFYSDEITIDVQTGLVTRHKN